MTLLLLALIALWYWRHTQLFEMVYLGHVRDILQYDCGRMTADDLVYRLTPGVCHFDALEFETTLTIDADGFRNAHTRPDAPIAVLGDSHAMGWGVGDSEVYSSLLQQMTGQDVRNLAMSSWGTPRELRALERYAASAETVVLQYCENDHGENLEYLQDTDRFWRDAPRWAERHNEAREAYLQAKADPLLLRLSSGAIGAFRHFGWAPAFGSGVPNLAAEAATFAAVVKTFQPALAGKRLIVFESNSYARNREGFAQAFRSSLEGIPDVDVVVIDSTKVVDRSAYYRLDDHLRASGHAALAQALAPHIVRKQ